MDAAVGHTGLRELIAGQLVPYGGDRVVAVGADLAHRFRPGDHLVVVQETGDLLHVPAAVHELVRSTVDEAQVAFASLADTSDDAITEFYDAFARRLEDDASFDPIAAANQQDVADAASRGRTTTRLALSARMRADMVAGLRTWRDAPAARDVLVSTVEHEGWSVETRRAPLGVVGFVFEGRPNVFADAAGVVRTGNAVVFRIGSDALHTAEAIAEHALRPSLRDAGLPAGLVGLVGSPERAAGWALFGDRRLALAVARGSGPAVAQLGAVARQAGVPVSLHGTGGAWIVVDDGADLARLDAVVRASLDRKVCNTLNVCCVVRSRADDAVPVVVEALRAAAPGGGVGSRLHVDEQSACFVSSDCFDERVTTHRADGEHDEPFATTIEREELAHEWEWEGSPEISLVVADDLDAAIELVNRHSPRFVASLVSDDPTAQERFYDRVDAPFVGDGFTRWVDGQYALSAPELGLSNWQAGRLLGRGAVLSGDSAHTLRYRARFVDPNVRR